MTDCQPIAELVKRLVGFDPESTGRATFTRVVRAARVCRNDCERCAEGLQESTAEFETLLERILVAETWFFRDRKPFELLQALGREWRAPGPMRILSAPCATGEEPYSAVMALLDAGLDPARFQVDGVDLSRQALETARGALYRKASFRECPPGRYFRVEGEKARLLPEVSGLVRFRHGNLLDPGLLASEKPYDVLFCRNLLIYLAADARASILAHVRRLLAPGGVIFAGHSELAAFLEAGFEVLPYPGAFACGWPAPKTGKSQPVAAGGPESRKPRDARREAAAPDAPRPASAEEPLAEARKLADAGQLQVASELCDRILAEHPLAAEVHYLKGSIEQAQGRTGGAEAAFRRVLYLDPAHYEALLQMSLLRQGQGDCAQGEIYRRRANSALEPGVDANA